MLALRHDLIRTGPDTTSGSCCIKIRVELDASGAVAQRVVAIKLISGKPACTWSRTQYALLVGCLHMKSPQEAGKQLVGQSPFAERDQNCPDFPPGEIKTHFPVKNPSQQRVVKTHRNYSSLFNKQLRIASGDNGF